MIKKGIFLPWGAEGLYFCKGKRSLAGNGRESKFLISGRKGVVIILLVLERKVIPRIFVNRRPVFLKVRISS